MLHDFPYSDMHELNLDWFLGQFKKLSNEFKSLEKAFKDFVAEIEDIIPSGDSVPMEVRQAIFNLLDNNAFANDDTYTNDLSVLEAWATEPAATLIGISAVYTQSGVVHDNDSLDSLRDDLIVTASYDNGTTQTVTGYTLSGTLIEGTSVITVSYSGKTTTFNVTVSASKSDMNNWVDGIAYTDLEIVDNEYIKSGTGEFASYNGWSRTGFVYCEGATSITFPPMAETGTNPPTSNAFYSDRATNTRIRNFTLSKTESVTITVPANAKYFGISSETTALNGCVGAGIVPHA